jgi:hypothetical protein
MAALWAQRAVKMNWKRGDCKRALRLSAVVCAANWFA